MFLGQYVWFGMYVGRINNNVCVFFHTISSILIPKSDTNNLTVETAKTHESQLYAGSVAKRNYLCWCLIISLFLIQHMGIWSPKLTDAIALCRIWHFLAFRCFPSERYIGILRHSIDVAKPTLSSTLTCPNPVTSKLKSSAECDLRNKTWT